MHVILLGPPGAGKGTQAKMLSTRLGLCHISSGDLFRETVASGGELGRELDAIMRRGDYVPDHITVRIVVERLDRADCKNGAVLDGFPRTVAQDEALDRELAKRGKRLDRAIAINVPDELLVRRLSSRWISKKTGQSFNTETLGQSLEEIKASLDPDDELYQRPDDTPETARRRISVYRERTLPLINRYREAGILREVDGNQSVEQVLEDLIRAVQE